MVDHCVKHQMIVCCQLLYIFPVSQTGVDFFIVHNGKSVIRCVGEHGQDMHRGYGVPHILFQKVMEGCKSRLSFFYKGIAVSDQDRIFFCQPSAPRLCPFKPAEPFFHFVRRQSRLLFPVQLCQALYPFLFTYHLLLLPREHPP